MSPSLVWPSVPKHSSVVLTKTLPRSSGGSTRHRRHVHAHVGCCSRLDRARRRLHEATPTVRSSDRSFQTVSNRAGDSYIDAEAITLTAWRAAWRLDAGQPADDQISIAAYWAAVGGYRVVRAVHVHGGVGVVATTRCIGTSCSPANSSSRWAMAKSISSPSAVPSLPHRPGPHPSARSAGLWKHHRA